MAILKRVLVLALFTFPISLARAEWQTPRQRGGSSPENSDGGGPSQRGTVTIPSRSSSRGIERRDSSSGSPSHRTTIIRNPNLPTNVRSHERVEITPSRYYWHRGGGRRYGHYYNNGVHWYGFYYGPSFYWARYYDNFWWHFDPSYSRWVYWQDGYWWWHGPGGGLYVYVDDRYYPYDSAPGGPPPNEMPGPSAQETKAGTWKSPNNKRMVQVASENADAFLYDTSGGSPVFLKQLGHDVENVRFSGGEDGKPVRILLEYRDNRFALFNENGEPLDVDVPQDAPPPPADLPSSNPPDKR